MKVINFINSTIIKKSESEKMSANIKIYFGDYLLYVVWLMKNKYRAYFVNPLDNNRFREEIGRGHRVFQLIEKDLQYVKPDILAAKIAARISKKIKVW